MPSLGLGLGLDKSQGLILAPEAVSWAAAVVAAGSSVPASVVFAVSEFVKGCQADASPNAGVNNWTAMKAVQLLAGPDTFAGIAVPLKGAAPTFFVFDADDYIPATGLLGDGESTYISTNRNNNADPQNNQSMGMWVSEHNSASCRPMGAGRSALNGTTTLSINPPLAPRNRNGSASVTALSPGAGLLGMSRNSAANFTVRSSGASEVMTMASQSPLNADIFAYRSNDEIEPRWSNDRFAFYWIGESVDLTALNARLATLMAAISAAHP